MKKYLFCFLIILSFAASGYTEKPKADISLLSLDLKYNKQDGVKICEMQQGIISLHYSFFDDENRIITHIGDTLCDLLEDYAEEFWVVMGGICTSFHDGLDKRFETTEHWHPLNTSKSLLKNSQLLNKKSKTADNPNLISDYHGLVVKANKTGFPLEEFHEKYPGILILNEAFYPKHNNDHRDDKYNTSLMFTGDERLENLKPQWKLYPKKHSEKLINQILHDFSSEMLVIKPRAGCCGYGVLIITKEELDKTLRYIFGNKKNLKTNEDPSYKYWSIDKHKDFIIEEYIPSDPVQFSLLGHEGLYDGTMRVGVCLTYDDHEINFHFLEGCWKLPPLPLESEGTLNEKHKSKYRIPFLIKIDSETQTEVERALCEALPILYEKLVAQ